MYINKPLKFFLTMFMTFLLTIVSVSPTYLNLNFGSPSLAQSSVSRNYDSLYTSSVIMLRNAKYGHILNIAEGQIGPNVVWSPGTAVQNNDNTIVVIKKEGVNIVQLFNRATRKVLGVNKSGGLKSKLQVQNVVGKFNQYQSFYVDYLPNGNIYFSSVAFPNLVINLPWGGSNKDNKYQLYDKVNIGDLLESQFKVDLQGDGANVSFWDGAEVVADKVITEPKPIQQVTQLPVVKTPVVNTSSTDNQYAKLKTGAVVVLRNVVKNNSLRILNTSNGTPIYSAPNGNPNDDSILVAVNKPNTNIYQFFNRKNGKVLSVTTKGQVGDWLEVWDRVPNFNPYQSFYIDVLPNGNLVLCPVAFPDKVINLPEGGKSNTFQHFTLWNKDNLVNDGNRQFRVDLLGDGASTNFVSSKAQFLSAKTQLPSAKTPPYPVTVQGGNEGSGGFWTVVCFVFCPTVFDGVAQTVLYGNKVIKVSLEKDGESWETASDNCQRDGGFLSWHINKPKNYAEKTCFVTQGGN
jgi:hypothetical protein